MRSTRHPPSHSVLDKRASNWLEADTQYFPEIAVIVGPSAEIERHVDHGCFAKRRPIEQILARGDENPAGAADPFGDVGIVLDQARDLAALGRGLGDNGLEIYIAVGDMHGENAVRLQMPPIKREGLAREQVNGNGVADEGIDRKYVEVLRHLGFK